MNKAESPGSGPTSPQKLPQPRQNDSEHYVVPVGLIVVSLVLAFFLWQQHHKQVDQTQKLGETVASYSNQVAVLTDKLARQVSVNTVLETNLAVSKVKASNDLAAVESTLANTSTSLEKARDESKAAESAAAEKDKKIADLENQNTDLDKQADDLRSSITNLEAQIQSTQKKLDADEGDKKLLLGELARLQAQKDDLEKKLNDLAFLKETVRKLKEELAVSRRLDWIRRGIYDAIAVKGGERLMHPLALGSPATNNPLNVELHQNGGVKINSSPTTGPRSDNQ